MTVSSGSYTMLSSGGNINLDAGTYVVSGKLTVSSITCKGKVKLILCDNALLTVNHGIRVNKENNNAALYIYSQSYGSSMGKIKSKIDNNSDCFGAAIGSSMKKDQGRIEIHGGHIYAEAREKASELGESGGGAGIGGGEDADGGIIEISGGYVYAEGKDYGAGIGGGEAGDGGDVNGDGTVSVADVTLLVNIIIGNEDETSIQNADINGDGTISIADVTALTDIILNESINIMNVVVYGAEGIRFE